MFLNVVLVNIIVKFKKANIAQLCRYGLITLHFCNEFYSLVVVSLQIKLCYQMQSKVCLARLSSLHLGSWCFPILLSLVTSI